MNIDTMLGRFAEHWSPKTIAQVNDYDVRIVKVQGEFTWHQHTDTDTDTPRGARVAVRARGVQGRCLTGGPAGEAADR